MMSSGVVSHARRAGSDDAVEPSRSPPRASPLRSSPLERAATQRRLGPSRESRACPRCERMVRRVKALTPSLHDAGDSPVPDLAQEHRGCYLRSSVVVSDPGDSLLDRAARVRLDEGLQRVQGGPERRELTPGRLSGFRVGLMAFAEREEERLVESLEGARLLSDVDTAIPDLDDAEPKEAIADVESQQTRSRVPRLGHGHDHRVGKRLPGFALIKQIPG